MPLKAKSWFGYIRSDTKRTVDLFAGLLMFVMPLSMALPNIVLGLLAISVLFHYKTLRQPWPQAVTLFGSAIFILLLLFFLNYSAEDWGVYLRYLLAFLLLLLFLQVRDQRLVKFFFLAGLGIAVVGSSIAIGLYKIEHPEFVLDIGDQINELLWMERPYFGFMLALGVFVCMNLLGTFRRSYFLSIPIIVFVSFLIYISARLGILLSIGVLLLFFVKSKKISIWRKIWLGSSFLLLTILALTFSKGLMSRMHLDKNIDNKWAWIKDYEPRFVIWPCAVQVLKNDTSWLTGAQNYDHSENLLTSCYGQNITKADKREYFLKKRFNTHNQFLDFFLIGGILPFLLLLSVFASVWFSKKYPFETKVLFLMFFAFFFVENVLYRQMGCYLFGTFAALYLNKK